MNILKKMFFICIIIFMLYDTVYAYIDPGAFSIVFQVAIAGLVSVAFLIKRFRSRIIQLFKRKKSESETNDQIGVN